MHVYKKKSVGVNKHYQSCLPFDAFTSLIKCIYYELIIRKRQLKWGKNNDLINMNDVNEYYSYRIHPPLM